MPSYRNITASEIRSLQNNGCFCEDWSCVKVKDGFIAGHVRNVSFSGNVFLGIFGRKISFAGGVERYSGIYNATVHNCVIEDDVYINQIKNYIANYIIGRGAVIESVDSLVVDGRS
ncbi:MAG: DUF4954 family protein, partial [Tannerella sp.]|nr:DUF4954 family protein [Tannerella sp.]